MSDVIMKEAHRVMTVCNACRYCEGFCAVFPAMGLRRVLTEEDLKFMANLCHNCRGCYYACQYAPPHEFGLNVPKTLAELRMRTYREFAWPQALRGLFAKNGLFVLGAALVSVLILTWASLSAKGSEVFFSAHSGPGSFYAIIPYSVMLALFSAIGLLALFTLWKGVATLWRLTKGKPGGLSDPSSVITAVWHCLTLRYLEGGGDGCNYPDDRFSMIRRYFHHAVFYGFMLCFASTSVAFLYDHLLGLPAPYAWSSLPVVLGTVGGIALLAGTGGMLWLKTVMDTRPADPGSFSMDKAFSTLLFLVSLSGLLLLFFRGTGAMGLLLCIHLGLVLGFFIALPFSKFVHAVYRYAALVRHAMEQRVGSPNP